MEAESRNIKLVRKGDVRNRRAPKRIGAILLTLGVIGLLSLLISAPASAQVAGGTVSGSVTDQSGAVIPHCRLTIRNMATGVTTTVTANAVGFYTVPNLIPGNYQMTITAHGFQTQERTGIVLEVGAQLVENTTLKVGQTTQKVEVAAEGPDVQLGSSTISDVVGSTAVVDLPLNGRSWAELATLQTGVAQLTTQAQQDTTTDASERATRGYAAQVSIGGTRTSQNNYLLDGISALDYANSPLSNVEGESVGVDAIQEFSVLTTNYDAEYGMTSGGVINATTSTGTNKFHGTAYDFLRNSALDARTYFDAPTIPPFRRNQFGGSIGGPIRTNRTFFFANYEGLRQLQGITDVSIVPSTAARAGTLCSEPSLAPSSSPCSTSTITVKSAAQAFLPFYPLPNGGLLATGSGDTGYFDFVDPQVGTDNFFTTRLDDNLSEKDHINGTFVIDRSLLSFPDAFDLVVLGFYNHQQMFSIEETHIFRSTMVNTARVGAYREFESSNNDVTVNNPLATDSSLGSQPGTDAARVSISGLTEFGGGADNYGIHQNGYTTPQFYDDFLLVRGKHSIKLGFSFERQELNTFGAPVGGTWTFGSFGDFLSNVPTSYTGAAILVASPRRHIRDTILAGYAQDDWSLRPYLTLNLGFRYEVETNPTEVNGLYAALPTVTSVTYREGSPFFESNPTLHNAMPRVGFAWDPFHNGKTSVRGGFGFFDALPVAGIWQRTTANLAPFSISEVANKIPAGTFYDGAVPYLLPSTAAVAQMQQNPPLTYIMQRNFSVQRELSPNLTVTVSYVGSHGVHLLNAYGDLNGVIPTSTSAGWLFPNPIGSGTRINPNWGAIEGGIYDAGSTYNSLQAQVTKRMSHGFQLQSSFTWGKSLDDSSSSLDDNDYTNSLKDPFYWTNVMAPSDFNVGRTLTVNALWMIPDAKSLSGFAGKAVNGWQLAGIYTVHDGMPFSPTFGSGANVAGFNNSAGYQSDFPDRLKTGPGCAKAVHPQDAHNYVNVNCFTVPTAPSPTFWAASCDQTSKIYGASKTTEPYPVCFNLLGNAGRNSLSGPGVEEFDLSAVKNNLIKRDNWNIQFRAELFNIFNRPNFAPPVYSSAADIFNGAGVVNGSAGVLTELATESRQIQFALKIIF